MSVVSQTLYDKDQINASGSFEMRSKLTKVPWYTNFTR